MFEKIRAFFKRDEKPDEIGDRMRAVDKYRADLAKRGMVERPPNAEQLVGSSDWIQRRGGRRRRQWIFESLMAGKKPDYRATSNHRY